MEILMLVIMGVLLFLGIRVLMQRQAGRMNEQLQEAITPETARKAVLVLSDEQHKEVYQAIAAEDARRAMVVFKQATDAPVKDCVIAVQALYRFPQPPPSEVRFEEGFNLNSEQPENRVQEQYVEDAIDEIRDETADGESSQQSPLAEADPNTGEILGSNVEQVPDIPGGDAPKDDDVDSRARDLMRQSGFDPDQELTIPEEWTTEEDEQAGFHLEVQRGDEKITLSHEDLEPWVHDQLYALLRDSHVDEAAQLLADHSPLTTDEAHRFLVVFKDQS